VMGVLIRGYLVFPKFPVPLAATLCRTHESLGVVGTYSTCSITHSPMPSLVDIGIHPPPQRPKTLSFFVCLFVALLHVRVCAPDFAMKAWEYRNDFEMLDREDL